MKFLEMINNIETRLLIQTLLQVLDINPTIHDKHFVKQISNMQFIPIDLSIGVSYLSEIRKEALVPYHNRCNIRSYIHFSFIY